MELNRSRDIDRPSVRYLHMKDGESHSDFVLRLFDAFYQRVFCFARKSAHRDLADDVTQEVFMRLLQHPRLDELEISCSYLIKIAHNLLRRRHTRWSKLQEILNCRVAESPSLRGQREPAPVELPDLDIDEAMKGLNPDERDALSLIICKGMSYEQAAKALNTTITTINNRKYRGLQKLKQWQQEKGTQQKYA